jgi:hypothetical protein
MDDIDIHRLIRDACKKAGSQVAFAEKIKVSFQFLNAVLCGRRTASKKILDAIGVKKIVRYQFIKKSGETVAYNPD